MSCCVLQVCVGATCPEERLHLLLPLLEASGGKLLAPVDSDLRLYTRSPDGKLRQRVVSSVRFSDLEVGWAGGWRDGWVGRWVCRWVGVQVPHCPRRLAGNTTPCVQSPPLPLSDGCTTPGLTAGPSQWLLQVIKCTCTAARARGVVLTWWCCRFPLTRPSSSQC